MTSCEKYLGLPMIGGKSKVSTFKELQERITKKVMGWKEKTISKAGRETLIKAVAQAIPTYSMSIFQIPKCVCDDINSILAKYWWGQTRNEKKIHWINWKRLCTPKNRGGMGFRDIHAFNLAMLAKQAWHLVTGSHSLFYRVYKARYFPRCSFMDAKLGHNPSFVWHSLIAARDVLRVGSMWRIGDGQSIKNTSNKWLPHPPLFKPGADTTLKVGDLIHHDSMQWNRPLIQSTFMQSTQNDILRLQLSNTRTRDKLYWKENKAREFTVKTAYQVALRLHREVGVEHSTVGEEKRFWNRIWRMNVPPKVRNFVWRACTDILPTRANLYRRKIPIDPLCSICGQTDETVGHALWECPMARNVWAVAQGRLQKCGIEAQSFYRLVRQLEEKFTGKEMENWATVAWAIWNARNRFCFEEKQSQPKDILQGASTLLRDYQRWNRDLAEP